MTFTYTFDVTVNRDLVRYHLSDTEEDTAVFSDEQIAMAISLKGSVNAAVISLIQFRLMKLANEPDAKVDFVSVDWKGSRAAWKSLLSEKRKEFGISSRTGSAVHVYRADSYQDEAPDYDSASEFSDADDAC